jgi:hypothetical protein
MGRKVLQPDIRGPVSLTRLGLESEMVVAEQLENGASVLRPGNVVTDAKRDVPSQAHQEGVQLTADDVAAGTVRPRPGRRWPRARFVTPTRHTVGCLQGRRCWPMSTRVLESTPEDLRRRREALLENAKATYEDLADRAAHDELQGDEWLLWDELEAIDYLLGAEPSTVNHDAR